MPSQELRREAHRQESDRSEPGAAHFLVGAGELNGVCRQMTAIADATVVGRGQLAIRGMNHDVIEADRLRPRRFPNTIRDPLPLYEREAGFGFPEVPDALPGKVRAKSCSDGCDIARLQTTPADRERRFGPIARPGRCAGFA
jgi:hypothetical protein